MIVHVNVATTASTLRSDTEHFRVCQQIIGLYEETMHCFR